MIKLLIPLLGAALVCGCASYPPSVTGKVSIDPESLAWNASGPATVSLPVIQGLDKKLYLTVQLNGHPVMAALDSGTFTVCDVGALRKCGVEVNDTGDQASGFTGSASAYAGVVKSFRIGEFETVNRTFYAFDLSSARKRQAMEQLPDVAMFLGADFLDYFGAVVDFEKKTLTLKRPNVPSEPASGAIR